MRSDGLRVDVCLARGNPPDEILKTAEHEHCDLIAMTTHGHRLLGDSDSRQHHHLRPPQEPHPDPAGARWRPGHADGLITPRVAKSGQEITSQEQEMYETKSQVSS